MSNIHLGFLKADGESLTAEFVNMGLMQLTIYGEYVVPYTICCCLLMAAMNNGMVKWESLMEKIGKT